VVGYDLSAVMSWRFFIHAHLYYPELWHELAQCIRNFDDWSYDLCVTTPHREERIHELVHKDFPRAKYIVCENRGYDVGPFVEVLNGVDLSKYDYVVKLHTKRDWCGWMNSTYVMGSKWRNWLLSFCKTKENLCRTLSVFRENPSAGMVAHSAVIVSHGDYLESESVKREADLIVRGAGLIPKCRKFVGGTMFVVRASLLIPLQHRHAISDFAVVKSHELGTLAHVYERAIGYVVMAQGMDIVSACREFSVLRNLWFVIVPIYRILYFIRDQMPDRRRARARGMAESQSLNRRG